MDEELPTERNDQLMLPSIANQSMVKSKSTFSSKKGLNKSQISLERINQLSQPKGQRIDRASQAHIRSNLPRTFTADDLFGDLHDMSYQSSYLPKEQELSTKDKRFRQLIHLFSDVHVPESTTIQSLKNVIQSNASLQYDSERWGAKKTPSSSRQSQEKLLNDSHHSKTEMTLIESCV